MALPLIALGTALIEFAPTVAGWIFGDKTGKAAEKVAGIAKEILGADDLDGVTKAIAADPAKALEFKTALIKAESEARRLEHEEVIARLADVASARSQTVELAKIGSPLAWGSAIVSGLVVVAFGVAVALVFRESIPEGNRDMAFYIIGQVSTFAGLVVTYWVGSTAGSAQKTNLIAASTPHPK